MIKSFASKDTERLFHGRYSRQYPRDIQRVAARELEVSAAATRLESLRVPPSIRLQKLSGDRHGQYSIRINDQWRICFAWKGGDAYDVEIVDYH